MKRFATLIGLLFVASFAAAQAPANFMAGPFDEALVKAAKDNKLILVEFFAPG